MTLESLYQRLFLIIHKVVFIFDPGSLFRQSVRNDRQTEKL